MDQCREMEGEQIKLLGVKKKTCRKKLTSSILFRIGDIKNLSKIILDRHQKFYLKIIFSLIKQLKKLKPNFEKKKHNIICTIIKL